NIIGLDATGTAKLGNGNGMNVSALNATIGASNVISGNNTSGIFVGTTGSATIVGNFIGTNAAGAGGLGNGAAGVGLSSSNNTIGGSTVAARNVISGNASAGINISVGRGQTATGNQILENYVGLA